MTNKKYIEYLSVMSSGFKAEYWQNVRRTCRSIRIELIENVLSKDEIYEIIQYAMPHVKECFANAFHIASIGDYDYVEGMVNCYGMPIDHAWNKTKDERYFDATFDLLGMARGDEYTSFYEGNYFDINRLSLESGVYGGYPFQVFNRENVKRSL